MLEGTTPPWWGEGGRAEQDAEATAGSAGLRRQGGGLQAALAAVPERGRARLAARASCCPRPGVGPESCAADRAQGNRLRLS